ncbi:MAG: tetratricopeptide repeat protein [Bacteroidales bacterium]|nr:tetratricopeptide repeat protein [Bacteroidales bacterium]
MKLDKKKLNDFLIKVLNDIYETNTFLENTNESTKKTYQIFSPELKTAVNLNFDIFSPDSENFLESMTNIVEFVEDEKDFDAILFINYIETNDEVEKFIDEIGNSSKLEIDFWNGPIVNNYLKIYERYLNTNKSSSKKLPYFITAVNDTKSIKSGVFKETNSLLDNIFFKNNNQICVLFSPIAGSGKTMAAIDYSVKHKKKFDHVAYVKIQEDFRIDFINSFINSELKFEYNISNNIFSSYNNLLEILKEVEGTNLLIIDSIDSVQHIAIIKEIEKNTGWKILITSESKLAGLKNIDLKIPSKNDIVEILTAYTSEENAQKTANLLEETDNNLFLANFIGKQIKYHKSLTFNKLQQVFDEKEKKVHHLNKYINPNISIKSANIHKRLLKYLMALYEYQVQDFTNEQKQILTNLICLPDYNFSFREIQNILQVTKKETDNFVNNILELHMSGWIEVNNNLISVNQSIRNILHKKLKPDARSISKMIDFVNKKITFEENNADFFKYIPYALHIMKSITTATDAIIDLNENLGEVMNQLGYYEKASYYFNFAGEILENIFDLRNPSEFDIQRLPALFIMAKDYEKALYYGQNNLEYMTQKYGNNSKELADAYKIMALIYQSIEDFGNAIYHIDYALDIYEQLFDKTHPSRQSAIEIHEELSIQHEANETISNFKTFVDNFFKE